MVTRRKLLLVVLAMLCITIIAVSFTIAYLSDQRTGTNTFTSGKVRVDVLESKWPGSGGKTVVPGTLIEKDPTVKNTGTVACFVRATIAVSDGFMGTGQNIMDFIEMGALNSNWVVRDGTWGSERCIVYYQGELAKGQETPKIFENLTLKEQDRNGQALLEGPNNTFSIVVTAEAVQTRVGTAEAGGTVYATPEAAFAALMP